MYKHKKESNANDSQYQLTLYTKYLEGQ